VNYNPYPYLRRAVVLLGLDDGCINRYNTEQDVLDNVGDALTMEFQPDQLKAVEEYLSRLNADQLEELCCGEQVDPIDEISALVDRVLNHMFDNLLP